MSQQKAKKKSDLSRAFSEDGALKTHVGGQALLEGIMMRGKYNWSVAVREPDGGIYVEEHDLASGQRKNGWMYWPLVRGCRAMVESLVIGYKALEIAATHAFAEDEPASGAPLQRGTREGEAASATSHREVACGAEGASGVASQSDPASNDPAAGRPFSWKDDFGRPEPVLEALGAQTSLEVVNAPVADDLSASECDACEPAAEPGERGRGVEDEPTHPEPANPAQPASAPDSEGAFGKREMTLSMVLGLVMGIVLFIAAPALLTNLIVGEYDDRTVLWTLWTVCCASVCSCSTFG